MDQEQTLTSPEQKGNHSKALTLLLCLTWGIFGAHRFYVGKKTSAIFMILTLGGLTMWAIFDSVMIAFDKFKDDEGRALNKENPTLETILAIFVALNVVFMLIIIVNLLLTGGLVFLSLSSA